MSRKLSLRPDAWLGNQHIENEDNDSDRKQSSRSRNSTSPNDTSSTNHTFFLAIIMLMYSKVTLTKPHQINLPDTTKPVSQPNQHTTTNHNQQVTSVRSLTTVVSGYNSCQLQVIIVKQQSRFHTDSTLLCSNFAKRQKK